MISSGVGRFYRFVCDLIWFLLIFSSGFQQSAKLPSKWPVACSLGLSLGL